LGSKTSRFGKHSAAKSLRFPRRHEVSRESLRLRQSAWRIYAPRKNEIFVDGWRAWRIREYTITKIIKMEFLSPRIFIDFCYCVSRTGIRLRQ